MFPILTAVKTGPSLRGSHVEERFVPGGEPTRSATAIVSVQRGLNIVVFDHDEASPDDPEEAWVNGQLRSVRRFGLPHLVPPAGLERVLDVALSPAPGTPPGTSRAEQEDSMSDPSLTHAISCTAILGAKTEIWGPLLAELPASPTR